MALASAIAALVAIGAATLGTTDTHSEPVRCWPSVVTAGWSWIPLDHTAQREPWLRALICASAALGVAGLLAAPLLRLAGPRAWVAIAALAIVACLSGSTAYSAQTITTAHIGSTPSAGASSATTGGAQGGGGAGGGEHKYRARQGARVKRRPLPLGAASRGRRAPPRSSAAQTGTQ